MLEARIIGVADVVAAISLHRSYRSAPWINKALSKIGENKGKLYCPDAVNACIKVFEEDGLTFD